MRKTRELFKLFPPSMAPQEACRTFSGCEANTDTACRSFCGGLCISVGTILFNSLSFFLKLEFHMLYCIYIISLSAFIPQLLLWPAHDSFSCLWPLFFNSYRYIFINTVCSSSRDGALWDFPYPFLAGQFVLSFHRSLNQLCCLDFVGVASLSCRRDVVYPQTSFSSCLYNLSALRPLHLCSVL